MAVSQVQARKRGLALAFGAQRLAFTLGVAVLFAVLNSLPAFTPALEVTLGHALVVVFILTGIFGLIEQRPKRLPAWLPRWIVQLAGVVVVGPIAVLIAHLISMAIDMQLAHTRDQLIMLGMMCGEVLLFGPWIAFGVVVRQRDVFARDQALAFELERTQLERTALDARLRLLQAQVEPHFLFNTLANVQALVDSGSSRASQVLTSLIAYLRAAVPHAQESAMTLEQEIELVRAYLELMRMRMSDRLEFAISVDPGAGSLRCPPMTILTLVENAIRHGIDPYEQGGRIDIEVRLRDRKCLIRVTDTGGGFDPQRSGLGTGLATLRERLHLTYGNDARLRLTEVSPHGVAAEIEIPAGQQDRNDDG